MVATPSQTQWSDAALRVLAERYLIKDEQGTVIETPDAMLRRVARAIAASEDIYDKKSHTAAQRAQVVAQWADRYYDLMASRDFLPNSPALANAGRDNGLCFSACFVLPVEDTLEGIFDAIKEAALVHRAGGGTGFSFSRLRSRGSRVSKTSGVASGPVSFMRVFDAATSAIAQGGMRRGANMGILRVDHPDIVDFITCKRSGGITNFNISVAITDEFMGALATGGDYDLIDPHTGKVVDRLAASYIWETICATAWETGDPGLFFIDRANASRANPAPKGGYVVEATNPCGEIPMGNYDVCNLGSINLGNFVTEDGDEIDFDRLGDRVTLAIRFLDDVIDANPFPLDEIAYMAWRYRRVGLGVMGWADALFRMGIAYDSDEAVDLGRDVMAFIRETAQRASADLATERGAFPGFDESIYRGSAPLRNSNRTTVAPTGTISIIADCSSGIEPAFALAYQHRVRQPDGGERVLDFVNPIFEAVVRSTFVDFYAGEILDYVRAHGSLVGFPYGDYEELKPFVTAHEIAPEWHVRMQAAFQNGSDSAVSKTVNLPHDATVADVDRAYRLAWDLGCMGITVFRDGCKDEQVLHVGHADEDRAPEPAPIESSERERPAVLDGATYKIRSPEGDVFVTINSDSVGPFEVFVTVGRAGSDIAALAEGIGRLISTALRAPGPVDPWDRLGGIASQLDGIGGAASVGFGPQRVRSLPDAVASAIWAHLDAQMVRVERDTHGAPTSHAAPVTHTDICPQCGNATLRHAEGCMSCPCGYSRC